LSRSEGGGGVCSSLMSYNKTFFHAARNQKDSLVVYRHTAHVPTFTTRP